MSRVLFVARMVFKKKSLSPAYYWMIIAQSWSQSLDLVSSNTCNSKARLNAR